jgi:hypothetical protein
LSEQTSSSRFTKLSIPFKEEILVVITEILLMFRASEEEISPSPSWSK